MWRALVLSLVDKVVSAGALNVRAMLFHVLQSSKSYTASTEAPAARRDGTENKQIIQLTTGQV